MCIVFFKRLGERQPIVLDQFQRWICHQDLVDPTPFVDSRSSDYEGSTGPPGDRGYPRDNQPGKRQFTFGISVGMNGIPMMLTIQKGNVQDKKHMRSLIRVCSRVLPEGNLLVFDCGGNTRENKRRTRDLNSHYLTLKAEKHLQVLAEW